METSKDHSSLKQRACVNHSAMLSPFKIPPKTAAPLFKAKKSEGLQGHLQKQV